MKFPALNPGYTQHYFTLSSDKFLASIPHLLVADKNLDGNI